VSCARQVASQEGRYLASLFNRYHVGPTVPNTLAGIPVTAPPFRYNHLGSFAYVGGDSAVLEAPAEHGETSSSEEQIGKSEWEIISFHHDDMFVGNLLET
jgi:NADH dehydrogenase FAD-containing subunit